MKSRFIQKSTLDDFPSEGTDPVLFKIHNENSFCSLALTDVLNCLKFSETEGYIPPLPSEWWTKINEKYDIENI